MQIFVNCLGQTKVMEYTQGENIEAFCEKIQNEFQIEESVALYSKCGKIEEISTDLENSNVEALVEVLGGKKKKKSYSTPKKNKHRHKNTKRMHALSFYTIKDDGVVEKVKKMCQRCSGKGKGIFMATHSNRYYCGNCGFTLMKKTE